VCNCAGLAGGAVECVGSMTIDASPAMNRETKCPERHYVMPVDDKSTNKQTNKHHKIYKDTKGHRVYLQDEERLHGERARPPATNTNGYDLLWLSFFVYKICCTLRRRLMARQTPTVTAQHHQRTRCWKRKQVDLYMARPLSSSCLLVCLLLHRQPRAADEAKNMV
jgi:hypothetical protein